MEEHEIYAQVGDEGFTKLVGAFYRQVPADDILGPMYPAHEMDAAEQRLCDYLIYRFGGPQRYIEQRGHPRLRGRHIPFVVNQAARDRWMQLMGNALDQAQLSAEAERLLRVFFDHMSTFMMNH